MNIPPHLEPLRRDVLMGECWDCKEVTDLQGTAELPILNLPVWRCWRCQGLPELTLHKRCEGCGAWFVGTEARKRCGHGPGCQEAP